MKLGQPSVNRMLRNMTYKEFREWMVFAELEPFDEVRQDYRIASIVAAIYNVHRGKNQRAVALKDVKIKFGDEEVTKQSVKEQMAMAQMAIATYHLLEEEQQTKRERARDRRQSRHPVRKALT